MPLPVSVRPALRHGRALLPLLLLGALPAPAAPDPDPLEPSEKAAAEWIRVRLETARLESQWLAEKPILQSLVEGMKGRAQTLEERRDLLTARTAKDREELAALRAKNQATADDLRAAEHQLQALSAKLRDLRPFLPPRLFAALALSYQSLGNPGLAVGERMQLVMTMLNRCLEFNRTITAGEEVLAIEGGASGTKSLEVIYWGLGYGYALDREARKAWYGAPGARGWEWEARPQAAPAVAKALAVNADKADPDFVVLPATLQAQGEEAK